MGVASFNPPVELYMLRGGLPAGTYSGLTITAVDALGRSSGNVPVDTITSTELPETPSITLTQQAPAAQTLAVCQEVPGSGLYQASALPAGFPAYEPGLLDAPPGLVLSEAAGGSYRITGTPTKPGVYENVLATVGVRNSYGNGATAHASVGTITITGEIPFGQNGCTYNAPPPPPPPGDGGDGGGSL
jgi:hypothetical protein